ncbi:MAG: adenine phosphoribosyltransferase [Candidatus Aegiribacteria sp.]|nr:adenine phosphoribosyltransferase [Candidatus Aegiribacteria sp.]
MLSITEISGLIRNVPDFPIPGVNFKDITTILTHPGALGETVKHLEKACGEFEYDAIAAIESRGFIFGSVLAAEKNLPLVLIRKPGKLPSESISEEYSLEYGSNILEMHRDSLPAGSRVLLVDDLLATGGSAIAAATLIRRDGNTVAGAAFVIDLGFLGGGKKLGEAEIPFVALIHISSE